MVNAKLRNVPEEGIYNWDPGAFFGIYKPDSFWFDMSEMRAKSASLEAARPVQPNLDLGYDAARARRHDHDAVAEHHRLLHVVGNQDHGARL